MQPADTSFPERQPTPESPTGRACCLVGFFGLSSLALVGVVFLLVWWFWPLTRQQRVDRLFKEWGAAPKPAGRTIPDLTYWGRDPNLIDEDIERLGPDYLPELCVALNGVGKKPEIGLRIIRELERQGDPQAVEALFLCVRHGGESAKAALQLLLKLASKEDAARVDELLAECLDGRYIGCYFPAVLTLAFRKDRRAVEPLLQRLNDNSRHPSYGERESIIRLLGEIKDRRAVESIRPYLRSEDESVREAATKALKALGER